MQCKYAAGWNAVMRLCRESFQVRLFSHLLTKGRKKGRKEKMGEIGYRNLAAIAALLLLG